MACEALSKVVNETEGSDAHCKIYQNVEEEPKNERSEQPVEPQCPILT